VNYEIGAHTTWLDGRLTINGDIFYIDWQDPQVLSATLVGAQPITKNADSAKSQGLEVAANWRTTDQLTVRATYSYANAELTNDVTRLITTIAPPSPPGFNLDTLSGESGDRLPGAPSIRAAFFSPTSGR
jgi:outer membrane receptor protein involved in Fe transport